MKVFLVILALLTSTWTNAEDRRQKILAVIDDELREVSRLSKRQGHRNPVILLRAAELFLEKARVIKEKENMDYLALPPNRRKRTNKKRAFRESRKYFHKAQRTCRSILKKFPRFKRKDQVYYILAFNAKEFQKTQVAKKFFRKAIASSGSSSTVSKNSKLALAEIHYNKKEYRKAIPLYEQALRSKDYRWYTKDLHNLAWCYFRQGKTRQAIERMREVHKLSQNSKYIDMSDTVERDLAYFYADAGKTHEAIKFYKRSGKSIPSLIQFAKNLKKQGKNTAAQKILKTTLEQAKNDAERIKIHLEFLELHRKFGNFNEHLKSSKVLTGYYQKGLLSGEQKKRLKFHLKSMSATLQRQASVKSGNKKYARKEKADQALEYFNLIFSMQKSKNYKSIFYSAEVLYSSGRYDEAIEKYSQAYALANKARDKKTKKIALEGLMASLGKEGISKKSKDKYLESSYRNYLRDNPRNPKNDLIYQRLFKISMERKDIKESEHILIRYRKMFPKKRATQEVMLANIMDYYKDKNDRGGILKWVKKINSKQFIVSKKYAKQVKSLLLNMQFEKVERAAASGNKKEALKLYVKIYNSKESGTSEKKNAAYNIAVLFHELSYGKESYLWAKRALEIMVAGDVKKFQATFIIMAEDLFGQGLVSQAAEINRLALEKICQTNSRYVGIFYKNSVVLLLANKDLTQAKEVVKFSRLCKIKKSIKQEIELDLMKFAYENRHWNFLEKSIEKLSHNKANYKHLILPLDKLRMVYRENGRIEEAANINKKIIQYYNHAKKRKSPIPVEALDIVARIHIKSLRLAAKNVKHRRLTFPEITYNKVLKKKFSLLDKLTQQSLSVLEVGSGKGIVKTYKILVDSYHHLANEVSTFIPQGKSPEYIKSFRTTMQKKVVTPLLAKVEEFNTQAVSIIRKESILSLDNYRFISSLKQTPIDIRHFPPTDGVIMDKGGRM